MILKQFREICSILQLLQLDIVHKAVMLSSLVGSAVIVSPRSTEHMQRVYMLRCACIISWNIA